MRPVAIAACLVVLFAGERAQAGGGNPSEHDAAVSAFEEGRKLLVAGNCDEGIHKLMESLAHEASIGARVSLADCYEPSNPLAAWKQLKEGARLALLNHDERLVVVEGRASALEPRLAMIRVVVPDGGFAEPGFELTLDGELVDPYLLRDGLIATTPGPHQLDAWTPGRRWSQSVIAAAASTTTTNVKLLEQCPAGKLAPLTGVAAPPVLPPSPSPNSSRRVVADVLTGAAVAGISTGVGFGLVALQKRNDLSSACGGDTTRCAAPPGSLDVARESAENAGTVSAIGFAFGGAALAGAVVLYLAGPRARPATAKVQITPLVSKGGEGVGMVGRW